MKMEDVIVLELYLQFHVHYKWSGVENYCQMMT